MILDLLGVCGRGRVDPAFRACRRLHGCMGSFRSRVRGWRSGIAESVLLLLQPFLLFSLLLVPLLLIALLLIARLLFPLLLLSLLLISLLLFPLLLFPLLLFPLLLIARLFFPLLLIALLLLSLLLLSLLLLSLLLVALLLIPLLLLPLLLLLLTGLPKHYLRRARDQGKAEQQHRRVFGVRNYGANYRKNNRLIRRTLWHRCRLWSTVSHLVKCSGRPCGKTAAAMGRITI